MAQSLLKFCLICVNICLILTSSPFDDILDNSKKCEEECTQSFAPHTYPNGSDNEACMRGCRLYTVTNFVTSDEPKHPNGVDDDGLTPAKHLCYRSCIEAYNETSDSTSACRVGCDHQETISLKAKENEDEAGSGIHLLKPIMQIREVVSKVFGMLRIVQTSLTTYFVRDDNKLVAMEGPVEISVQVVPPVDVEETPDIMSKLESNSEGEELNDVVADSATSIECISRRVGMPPYLLLVSLITFVLFLIYVLFVICSSGNKKEKKAKLGMPIPTHALPIKLVRPEDLTKLSLMDEEENQAPPLPHKVKLPDNTII